MKRQDDSGCRLAVDGTGGVGSTVDLTGINGTAPSTGLGVSDAGTLRVAISSDSPSTGNTAASATGAAVPADADYSGLNVSGTLRGATGVNPAGSVFAQQVDIASVNGVAAATVPVTVAAGAAVIGHVITDTGSTTAVTGNVTVVQATGTNLHAVIDSGTTTVTQATGTNLHTVVDSGAITVSGSVTVSNSTATGVLSAPAQAVTLTLTAGAGTVGIYLAGAYTGQIEFESTIDNTNWFPHEVQTSVYTFVNATAGTGDFVAQVSGFLKFRCRASALSAGSVTVTLLDALSNHIVNLGASAATIGAVFGTGTAGTAATGVLTVQGIASMTPVQVSQATAASLNATVVGTGTFAVQATLAAGTALIGQVAASSETNTIYNGTTALTPKFAKVAASSNGDNTLVAGVGGKKIRVLGYNLFSSGTVNAKFQSAASGTDLTGLKYFVANTGISVAYSPVGWFETAASALLNLNLSAGVAVGGELIYIEV